MSVLVQALDLPVGVVVVKTFPAPSTAAQKVVEGQEMELIQISSTPLTSVHAEEPPLGLEE